MATETSESFERLNPRVQHWIWHRRWTELRDAQERAIPLVLEGKEDLIISAATASGKTEAAFLPIASRLLEMKGKGLALYISPLKALINDQLSRLEEFLGSCDLPVHAWHGDITASKKSSFEKDPRGVLLITPESLESIFVRRGFYLQSMFRMLIVVVVDELHSFINKERGYQLACLLCRLETVLGRRVPRIGLSATLGDMKVAADFLRSGEADGVEIIESTAVGQELRLLIKGYEEPALLGSQGTGGVEPDCEQGMAGTAIARDMFKALRGSKNLVFANSRRSVEEFTDRLVRICEAAPVPCEFYAHHSSLSKSLREDVESRLKEPNRPATAVCTSTLEMGIDIGQVKSVAQLAPPFSVASLRQRLGRSGRRGEPAVLRMFVTEPELHCKLALQDSLRLDVFQAVAVTNLLLKKWCEPPARARLHLSTLVQQILSLIAQYGGLTAKDAWNITCNAGPFRNVDPQTFGRLLRALATKDVLTQSPDGTLLHGAIGEQIVNHYSFYTAFWTSEEFKLIYGTTVLGSLPVSQPITERSLILFGGRRWRVVQVDDHAKVVEVIPAQGGRAPNFAGRAGQLHRHIHEEMYHLYRDSGVPAFLDRRAALFLREGRAQFAKYGLDRTCLISFEGDSLLFLWAGDLMANTLLVHLQSLGYSGLSFSVGLLIEDINPDVLKNSLRDLAESGPPDPVVLAESVPNRTIDRYDHFLSPELLSQNYASCELDAAQEWDLLKQLSSQLSPVDLGSGSR